MSYRKNNDRSDRRSNNRSDGQRRQGSGSGSGFGQRRPGSGSGFGQRRPLELHKATCAKCNKETEVPFKPDGSKPVYCRECFQQQKPSRY